uniref:Uncharacterized protein n=1 Tax=Fagus sylvatica TaxID=28930 RepID=A0A2N9GL36_FAGSY
MAEVVGLTTSREVWIALENTFSHRSKAREIRLKDNLQLMKRGTRSVSDLGSEFSSFSTAQMALTPLPCFADLVPKAESFELFQKSLEPAVPTVAAFVASNRTSQKPNQRNTSSLNPQGRTGGHGRGRDASLVDALRVVRSAVWKAIMRINAGNGMIAMVMPLKLSLPRPSLPHAPSLEMKP